MQRQERFGGCRRSDRRAAIPLLGAALLTALLLARAPSAPAAAPGVLPPTSPGGSQYLAASQLDIVALLPPPPTEDSPEQQADLAAVLEAQRAAHADGSIAHAVADVQQSCARFSDALGIDLAAPGYTKLLAFLDRMAFQGASISRPAKQYWKRTRPYAFSAQVERLGDMSPQSSSIPEIDIGGKISANKDQAASDLAHSSYPSGHATFGTVCTILLVDIVPERRAALFARNRDYEHSRMVMGAHFPSDLEAGRIAGTLGAELLLQQPKVRRELAAARPVIRAGLGLPPQPPAR